MLFDLLNQSVISILFLAIGLVIAITFHEFSHAAMATFLGDITPRLEGRLTLNPIRHLDLWGSLFLLIAGFGWGKPVTFNPNFIKYGKWGIAAIGAVGPLSNIFIAFVFIVVMKFGIVPASFANLFMVIIFINLLLAIFNLIPISPLDGSKILQALLPESKQEFVEKLEKQGPIILLAILVLDNFFGFHILSSIINPIFNFVWNILNF